ncbi:MAG: VanZ family protein [Bacteroidales bacterium]|jgi:VanZ family protein|nr:VanZ family protein [Bacteroidales bacterium]
MISRNRAKNSYIFYIAFTGILLSALPSLLITDLYKIRLLSIRADYISHFFMLLFIAFIYCRYLYIKNRYSFMHTLVTTVFIAISFEMIQLVIPERSYNNIDMLANVIGASSGCLSCYIMLVLKKL